MDSNKKMSGTKQLILGIIALALLVASIFSVINLFGNLKTKEEKAELAKGEYHDVLKELYGSSISDLKELNSYDEFAAVIPQYYFNNLLPFSYTINEDGVLITNSLTSQFYDLDLRVGSTITSIDGTSLKGLEYSKIIDLLYKSGEKLLTVDNEDLKVIFNSNIPLTKKEVSEGKITIKIYSLDYVTTNYLYDLAQAYDTVVFDLTEALVNTPDGMITFASLFYEGEIISYRDTVYKALSNYSLKAKNVNITVGQNQNLGINFLVSILQDLNIANLHFDKEISKMQKVQVLNYIVTNNYVIFHGQYVVERVGGSSDSKESESL